MSKLNRESFTAAHPVVLEAQALQQLDALLEEAETAINDWIDKRANEVADAAFADQTAEIARRKLENEVLIRYEERRAKQHGAVAEIADHKEELAHLQAKEGELERQRQKRIDHERRWSGNTHREIEVHCWNNARFKRKSFAELESDLGSKVGATHRITAEVVNYSLSIRISVSIYNSLFRNEITADLEQGNTEILEETFVKIKRLFCDNYVPLWQRRWAALRGYGFLAIVLALLCSLGTCAPITYDDARAQNVKQAHELIDRGVTQEDLPKAVELTLRLQTNYPTLPRTTYPLRRRSIALAAALVAVGILLFLGPKSVVVAIGEGKQAIESWKKRAAWLAACFTALAAAILEFIKPAFFEAVIKWVSSG